MEGEGELRVKYPAACLYPGVSLLPGVLRPHSLPAPLRLRNLCTPAPDSLCIFSSPVPRVSSSSPACTCSRGFLCSASVACRSVLTRRRHASFLPSSPAARADTGSPVASHPSWSHSRLHRTDCCKSALRRLRFSPSSTECPGSSSRKRRGNNADKLLWRSPRPSSCAATVEGVRSCGGEGPYVRSNPRHPGRTCHCSRPASLSSTAVLNSFCSPVVSKEENTPRRASDAFSFNATENQCRFRPCCFSHEGGFLLGRPRVQPGRRLREDESGPPRPSCVALSATTRLKQRLLPSSLRSFVSVASSPLDHGGDGFFPLPRSPPPCSPPSRSGSFVDETEEKDRLLFALPTSPTFSTSAVHASASFSPTAEEEEELGEEDGFHFVLACEDEEEDTSSSAVEALQAGEEGGVEVDNSNSSGKAQTPDASCFPTPLSATPSSSGAAALSSSALPHSLSTAAQCSERPSPFPYVREEGADHHAPTRLNAGDESSFLLTGKPPEGPGTPGSLRAVVGGGTRPLLGGAVSTGPGGTVSVLPGGSVAAAPVGAVRTEVMGANGMNDVQSASSASEVISSILSGSFEQGGSVESSLRYPAEARKAVSFDHAGGQGLPAGPGKSVFERGGSRQESQAAFSRQVYRQPGDLVDLKSDQASRKQSDPLGESSMLAQYNRAGPAHEQLPQQSRSLQPHALQHSPSPSPAQTPSQKSDVPFHLSQQDGGRPGKALASPQLAGPQHLVNPSISREEHAQPQHPSSLPVGTLPSTADLAHKQQPVRVSLQTSSKDPSAALQHLQNMHFQTLSPGQVAPPASQAHSLRRGEYTARSQQPSPSAPQQEPRGDLLASVKPQVTDTQIGVHRKQEQPGLRVDTSHVTLNHNNPKQPRQAPESGVAQSEVKEGSLLSSSSLAGHPLTHSQQTSLPEHRGVKQGGVQQPLIQEDRTHRGAIQEKRLQVISPDGTEASSQNVEGQVHRQASPTDSRQQPTQEASIRVDHAVLPFSVQPRQHPPLSSHAPLLGPLSPAGRSQALEGHPSQPQLLQPSGGIGRASQQQTQQVSDKPVQGIGGQKPSPLQPLSDFPPLVKSPPSQTPVNVSRQTSPGAPSTSQLGTESPRIKSAPSSVPSTNRVYGLSSAGGTGIGGKVLDASLFRGLKPRAGSSVSRSTAGALSNLNTSSLRAAAKLHAGREPTAAGLSPSLHGIGGRPFGKQHCTAGEATSPRDVSLQQQAGTKGSVRVDEGKGPAFSSPVRQVLTPEEAAVAAAVASVSTAEAPLSVETPSSIQAALPPVEWLPSIPHLLHIFSYVKDPVLEETLRLQDKEISRGDNASTRQRKAERSVLLPSCPPLPPPCSPQTSAAPLDASPSSTCLPTFPPPLSSLLYPPQPPVHFGPLVTSPLSPERFLLGAIDSGLLEEGNESPPASSVDGARDQEEEEDSTNSLHELLQPSGARVALASRKRQLEMLMVDSICDTSTATTTTTGDKTSHRSSTADVTDRKSAKSGQRVVCPLIPPGHRLCVVRLDIRKACGSASIVEELVRKLAADDAAKLEAQKKNAAAKTKQEEGGEESSSVERAAEPSPESHDPGREIGKGSSSVSPEETPVTHKGGTGEPGKGEGEGSVSADTGTGTSRPTTPSSPQDGASSDSTGGGGNDSISDSTTAPSSLETAAGSSSSLLGVSRRPHGPLLPPPEEILWDMLDWLEGVEALCVAWLAESGLPTRVPLLQKPSSTPPAFPFLSHRQKRNSVARCLSSQNKQNDNGKQSDDLTPSCHDTAKRDENPACSSASLSTRVETGDSSGEQGIASRSPNPSASETGLRVFGRKEGESTTSGEWVLALKDLLVADVRKQLGRAAVREVDFACLVQMAEVLRKEELSAGAQRHQQLGLVGVLRAPFPPLAKTGVSEVSVDASGKLLCSGQGQIHKSPAPAFALVGAVGEVASGRKEPLDQVTGRGSYDGNKVQTLRNSFALDAKSSLSSAGSGLGAVTSLLPSARGIPFPAAASGTPTASSRHSFLSSTSSSHGAGAAAGRTPARRDGFGACNGVHGGGTRTPPGSNAVGCENRSSLWSLHKTTPEPRSVSIDRSAGSDFSFLTSSLPSSSPAREDGVSPGSLFGGAGGGNTVSCPAVTANPQSCLVQGGPASSPHRACPPPVTNGIACLPSPAGAGNYFSSVPLLNALTCAILEVDVYDPHTQVRVDDRLQWRLTAGDSLLLQHCQQLAADLGLPPAVVARYRVALHKAVERQKNSLVIDYRPHLRVFHLGRGLRLPPGFFMESEYAGAGGGTGQPASCPASGATLPQPGNVTGGSGASVAVGGDRLLSGSSAGGASSAPVERGGGPVLREGRLRSLGDWLGEEGHVLYKSKRSLSSPSSSLLRPWCTQVVQPVRRTSPSWRRPLFLQPKNPLSCSLLSSSPSPSPSPPGEGLTIFHTASVGSSPQPPFLSSLLSQSVVRERLMERDTEVSSLSLEKMEATELLERSSLGDLFPDSDAESEEVDEKLKEKLLEREQARQRDLFNQLQAGTLPEFGPLILRGPDAATWPGRSRAQKRRRR